MGTISWDGTTRAEGLDATIAARREELAARAKACDWDAVLALLEERPFWANATRPGGRSLYAPLHQAAYGGAPVEVVDRLVALGAWRTLRTARGEQPVDIARRRAHEHLVAALTPTLQRTVAADVLSAIQGHFHGCIRGRANELVERSKLRLPELEPLLELPEPQMWFPVPGMYGGFSYRLDRLAGRHVLVAESWCRVVGGSGECHVISAHGALLVERGFV